jgi:hypothetical protein
MRSLLETLKVLDAPDPNPSGTASTLISSARSLANTGLRTQAQREKFVKGNILIGNIYKMVAETLKFTEKPIGAAMARKSLTQATKQKRSPSLGGFGAAGAINVLADR